MEHGNIFNEKYNRMCIFDQYCCADRSKFLMAFLGFRLHLSRSRGRRGSPLSQVTRVRFPAFVVSFVILEIITSPLIEAVFIMTCLGELHISVVADEAKASPASPSNAGSNPPVDLGKLYGLWC